jgi:hypothetical protein
VEPVHDAYALFRGVVEATDDVKTRRAFRRARELVLGEGEA